MRDFIRVRAQDDQVLNVNKEDHKLNRYFSIEIHVLLPVESEKEGLDLLLQMDCMENGLGNHFRISDEEDCVFERV